MAPRALRILKIPQAGMLTVTTLCASRLAWLAKTGEEGAVRAGEGAAAKGERADGSCGRGIGNALEADLRATVDGHRGYQRNSYAGADQTEQAGELPALENHLGRN